MNIFLLITFQLVHISWNRTTLKNNENILKDMIYVNTEREIVNHQKDTLMSLLSTMKANKLDIRADIYWKIIKRGKSSIPLLIEHLTDTTMTNVYDKCKNGKLNVGEISYFALEEIAEFPAFSVTHIQFDVIDDKGCWNFYKYLFDNRKKKEYQKMVRDFYNSNKYVFVKFKKQELNESRNQYQIVGKLKWKR